MSRPGVTAPARICPVTEDDLPAVAEFLQHNMTSGVDADAWLRSFRYRWSPAPPNHGFMLVAGESVVGVYVAYYSRRTVRRQPENFCNLGAWSVLPDYRLHGARLLKALLGQPDMHFVDLSPSGNVIAINQRLGFDFLDTATSLTPTFPWVWRSRHGRVSADPAVIERTLTGRDLELYRDHADAAAARHLVLVCGDEWGYLVFRLDRRRSSPRIFASLLHVGNPHLLRRMVRPVSGYLLARYGVLAILTERHVLPSSLPRSISLSSARHKMFRSPTLTAADIDYFYSELVALEW